ncbi:hypothetical protein [Halobacteriaceae bacterium SHR40]|uniref:hypothetical protein n=1 Tax=Halovenus amylolytica TaxID=2500550 RepID=UPI000FE33CD5
MSDEGSPHERMQRYEELEAKEREYRGQKRAVLEDVKTELASTVERAVDQEGANVTVDSTSRDGTVQTLTARLDRAALVAEVTDELPEGFTVKRVKDDGTLAIEWSRRKTSPEQRASAILQAIVNEELETDADELIVSAPTRSDVIERAVELGVARDLAGERLQRLDDIGLVDIEDGQVFPDSDG